MTTIDGMQPVVVNVGACRCIGGPDAPPVHPDGDEVYLAPEASMVLGLHANAAISAASDHDEDGKVLSTDYEAMHSGLGRVFIVYGIVGWNFTDADGKPVPFVRDARGEPMPPTKANIDRLLSWGRGGLNVAEAASDLYSEAVLGPLRRKSSPQPLPGQTDDLTSPIRPSQAQHRSSSKSSSPKPSETPA